MIPAFDKNGFIVNLYLIIVPCWKAWKLLFMTLTLFLVLIKNIHDLKHLLKIWDFSLVSKYSEKLTSQKSDNFHIKSFPWIARKISIHGLFLLATFFIQVHFRDALKWFISNIFNPLVKKYWVTICFFTLLHFDFHINSKIS